MLVAPWGFGAQLVSEALMYIKSPKESLWRFLIIAPFGHFGWRCGASKKKDESRNCAAFLRRCDL